MNSRSTDSKADALTTAPSRSGKQRTIFQACFGVFCSQFWVLPPIHLLHTRQEIADIPSITFCQELTFSEELLGYGRRLLLDFARGINFCHNHGCQCRKFSPRSWKFSKKFRIFLDCEFSKMYWEKSLDFCTLTLSSFRDGFWHRPFFGWASSFCLLKLTWK